MTKRPKVVRRWTDEQKAYLRNNRHLPVAVLARTLDRTEKAIEERLYSIGFSHRTGKKTRR